MLEKASRWLLSADALPLADRLAARDSDARTSTNHEPPGFNLISGSNLGAMEIATFISLVLCGVGVAQGYSYYHHFITDRPFLKVMVGTVLALEVSHSIATADVIYDFTITLAAAAVKPTNSYALSATPLLETLITAIVQSFFAYRIRSLSGNLYISSLCWVLSFLRFLGGVALAIEAFLVPHEPGYVVHRDSMAWLITLVLSVGAAVDLLIAASLCYYLNRLMSPITMRRTARIMDRLISWTIQTGLVTRLDSIQSESCYVLIMNKYDISCCSHLRGIWMAIYTVLAKLYSNSLLLSMIVRLNVRMVNRAPLTTSKSDALEFAILVTQPGLDRSHGDHIPGGSRR
ncbi:hypothetical protein BD779DRAFT_1715344 [Infundibulicybe gibba]|nr:hypothetical protein BD779DRAFT_1715344 [Infundibulicybe gibba]